MNNRTMNKILVIMIFGILFVVIAPFLFTRPFGILDFSATGSIGDTIGGITAPITSLLGSILVFFALKAQIDANRLIQDQISSQKEEEISRKKVQYLSEEVNMVRNDINEFSYTYIDTTFDGISNSHKKQKFNYLGSDAINKFIENIRHMPSTEGENIFISNPKLKELYDLLTIIKSLFVKIENEEISIEDKYFFKNLLNYQYSSKVLPAFIANETYRFSRQPVVKEMIGRRWGIPDEFFDLINQINVIIKP